MHRPGWVDEGGHGTHVAGIVAAARNGIGVTGVAPDATIVNLRAGQDSGFFFFYETVSALLYAGDMGIDVVNMSFFTDPWLYNCASLDDYISGAVTEEQIEEQAMIRTGVLAALEYAHEQGVTLVAAAGNSHHNLALPERVDTISPDYPLGTEQDRVVTNNCLDLPSEGPDVLSVGSVGPSTTKSDFSNYGLGDVEVAAPGGWFRDLIGTPNFQQRHQPGALVVPVRAGHRRRSARRERRADRRPTSTRAVIATATAGRGSTCRARRWRHRTSPAKPPW